MNQNNQPTAKKLFGEGQIKSMLQQFNNGEISFGKFVELLNQKSESSQINISESVKSTGVSCFFYSKKQYDTIRMSFDNWLYPKFQGKQYTEMRCISYGFKNNFDDCILLGIGTVSDVTTGLQIID